MLFNWIISTIEGSEYPLLILLGLSFFCLGVVYFGAFLNPEAKRLDSLKFKDDETSLQTYYSALNDSLLKEEETIRILKNLIKYFDKKTNIKIDPIICKSFLLSIVLLLKKCSSLHDQRVKLCMKFIHNIISKIEWRNLLFQDFHFMKSFISDYLQASQTIFFPNAESQLEIPNYIPLESIDEKILSSLELLFIGNITSMALNHQQAPKLIGNFGGIHQVFLISFHPNNLTQENKIKKGLGCLMALIQSCPINRNEIFKLRIIDMISDLLKLHSWNAEIYKYSITILYILIKFDSASLYPIHRAKEQFINNNLSEILLHAKRIHPKESDLINIAKDILDKIAEDYS